MSQQHPGVIDEHWVAWFQPRGSERIRRPFGSRYSRRCRRKAQVHSRPVRDKAHDQFLTLRTGKRSDTPKKAGISITRISAPLNWALISMQACPFKNDQGQRKQEMSVKGKGLPLQGIRSMTLKLYSMQCRKTGLLHMRPFRNCWMPEHYAMSILDAEHSPSPTLFQAGPPNLTSWQVRQPARDRDTLQQAFREGPPPDRPQGRWP